MPKLAVLLAFAPLALACRSPQAFVESQTRIQALERENAELGTEVAALEEYLSRVLREDPAPLGCSACMPSIEARVLAASHSRRLVVIDQGRTANVKIGYVFNVYRDATYKGMIRIEDVQETMSAGQIVSEKRPIEPSDSACTNL